MTTADIIDIINRILEDNSNIDDNSNPTFLSVIRRDYDEDLISRIIAYALSIDLKFVENLFKCYFNVKDIDFSNFTSNVVCEKFMAKGRADIFVEIKNKEKNIATITIENKIYSYEHDNQTQIYYDWVTRNYKDCYNAFFYLRPGYNYSEAYCKKYRNITYVDLVKHIEADNKIIRDFEQHIVAKLGDKNMTFNEFEKDIINNYEVIMSALNEAKSKLENKQNSIIDRIEKNLSSIYTISHYKNPSSNANLLKETNNAGLVIQSYRLYKEKWYVKDNYYFYVEIKFESGKLDNIFLQGTIKAPSKNKIFINKFIEDNSLEPKELSGLYYVIEKEQFTEYVWTDDNWEDSFVEFASKKIPKYIAHMDKIFNSYIKFSEKEKVNN